MSFFFFHLKGNWTGLLNDRVIEVRGYSTEKRKYGYQSTIWNFWNFFIYISCFGLGGDESDLFV